VGPGAGPWEEAGAAAAAAAAAAGCHEGGWGEQGQSGAESGLCQWRVLGRLRQGGTYGVITWRDINVSHGRGSADDTARGGHLPLAATRS
jgi:hypothetical protein